MKPSLAGARATLIAAVHLAVVGGATLTGCSPGAQEVDDVSGWESVGHVSVELQLDASATLNSLAYSITGPSAFTKNGTLDVHASTSLSALIGPIPAGAGFTITLAATATDGATCGGAGTFDIAAGATTPTVVRLTYHEAPRPGSVLLSGSLNVCPVTGAALEPSDLMVGQSDQLIAEARDLDHGPSVLAYAWATDLGTFSDASVPRPTFTCNAAGTAHVTVSVTDGDPTASCAGSRAFTIVCNP